MDVTDLVTGAAETANILPGAVPGKSIPQSHRSPEAEPETGPMVRTDPRHGPLNRNRPNSDGQRSIKGKPMQKGRFLMGLVFSSLGIGLMLAIAVGALQNVGLNGRLSLPAVGVCMVVGLVLLGGGFGVMATAAPTFDDDEFDRLVADGDASRNLDDWEGTTSAETSGPPPHDIGKSDNLKMQHSESS